MATPVQPVLNEGQLRLLIDAQHESETLDYKRELDLLGPNKRRAIVELAKDVGAMASRLGGYLCVGLDDRGRPTGLVTEEQAREMDEARLRQRLERYLPDGIDLRSAVHEIDGNRVGLIYVGAHQDGLVVFKADGIYEEQDRPQAVFREGEVFVRRGTQSRRWSQEDARRWIREQGQRSREEAMAEAAAAFRPLREQAERTEGVVEGPADALNWSLDRQTLVSAVTDQLRRSDDIPFRLLIDTAPAHAEQILSAAENLDSEAIIAAREAADSELGGLLDRLIGLAARGVTLRRDEIIDPTLDALEAIYNLGFADRGVQRTDTLIPAPKLWLMIIERLYALGALATRKRHWAVIRRLAQARPDGYDREYYRSLLRHGHIMAARAELLQSPDAPRSGASVLQLALQHIARIPELRPDASPQDERLLSSLCQFDLLVIVATVDATGRYSSAVLYPHFKRFYSHRSDPAAVALLEDTDARRLLFPQDDVALSNLLWSLGRIATGEAFFISGWDGYEDPRILRLFEEHPPQELADEL